MILGSSAATAALSPVAGCLVNLLAVSPAVEWVPLNPKP